MHPLLQTISANVLDKNTCIPLSSILETKFAGHLFFVDKHHNLQYFLKRILSLGQHTFAAWVATRLCHIGTKFFRCLPQGAKSDTESLSKPLRS